MANFGKQNYTGFQAINLKGSGGIRVAGYDTAAGTLWIAPASLESDRAWGLPDKSGTFPISGTFAIQLPAIAANVYSTIVTVTGIRAEDGLTVSYRPEGGSYVYGTQGTAHVLTLAEPGNGQITLTFWNPGNSTGYIRLTGSYTAVR